MEGGKKYGEGVYGKTYDFACQKSLKKNDNESFCKMLKERRVVSIQLHSFDKTIEIEKPNHIRDFIRFIDGLNCCVAKVFKSYLIGIDHSGFTEELKGMKVIYDIFGEYTEKETTLTSLKFMRFNFVAAYIVFQDKSHMYTSFTKKCTSDLEHTELSTHKYEKLAKHILRTLEIMQRKNFGHCDLKPDNMIYCKKDGKFKLIDWGLSNYLVRNRRLVGTTVFGCPIARYLNGYPALIAVRLMYISTWKKKTEWFNSVIFQELYKMIYKEFFEIIDELSDDELLKKYKNKFDIFSFGLSLGYLIHKNNLNWKKHKEFVTNLVSMRGYICAKDAYDAIR